MGSLRMALALPHLGVYGGIRRFLELGEVWIRRGHEVAILVPEGSTGRPWVPFSGSTLPLSALPFGGWDLLLSPDPTLFLPCRPPGPLRLASSVSDRAPPEDRALRSADLVP